MRYSLQRAPLNLALASCIFACSTSALAAEPPETLLQFFETNWNEVADRIPEIAKLGYTAIWLPPPTKGAEGQSDVGFAVFDRFDLGDKDQRGTIATRYGTKAELIRMIDEAHRFGVKVYFDIVMNHNSNPAKIENSGVSLEPAALDEYPGTHPLDYHVLPARDLGNGQWEVRQANMFGGGTYTLGPDIGSGESIVASVPMPMGVSVPGYTHLVRAPRIDFSMAGELEEQYLSLLGLVDFAIEQLIDNGAPAANDGTNLVADLPLPRFIRHPQEPDKYPGGTPVEEDIREMMVRWIEWFGNETNCDGLRLDAIKHVPPTFFDSDFQGDPIDFNGAFQNNLDERRGYTDSDDDDAEQDALLFGESFTGDLSSLQTYRNTGMYLLDFPLLFTMAHDGGVFARWGDGDIGQLSYPQGGMTGAFNEFGGLGRYSGVSFVQSHDTYAPNAQPNAAHAFALTRVGNSVVFYDGNNYDPNSFVTPGRADALGEMNSDVITTLTNIRKRFARGGMFNRFVDGDTYVYERVVPTSAGTFGASLLVAITDNTQDEARFGEFDPRPLIVTEFPPGTTLVDLTQNGALPQVQVLDPSAVPQSARDRAIADFNRSSDFPLPMEYGLVYLQIPAGPDVGYVAYAPQTSVISVTLEASNSVLNRRTIQTAGPRQTPAGAPVSTSNIEAFVVPLDKQLSISVITTELAESVYLRIDAGNQSFGLTQISGSAEGLYDGFITVQPDPSAMNRFSLSNLDLNPLNAGVHLVTIRAVNAGSPSFFQEENIFILIDTPGSNVDAGLSPTDDGGATPNDAGINTQSDAGLSIDQDPDRDGFVNTNDNCPKVSNPRQSDFDTDGIGDSCDACPETPPAQTVDSDGCQKISSKLSSELDAIIQAILMDSENASALDINQDGLIDVQDFALKAQSEGTR